MELAEKHSGPRCAAWTIGVSVGAFAGTPAVVGDIITVPGDVPTLIEAVQLAQDGDLILASTNAIAEPLFTDLGGKAITVQAGTDLLLPFVFQARNNSTWRLPDGAALVGSQVRMGEHTIVEADASVTIVAESELSFNRLTLRENASAFIPVPLFLDIDAQSVVLEAGATLDAATGDGFTIQGLTLNPGSTLYAGRLAVGSGVQTGLVATEASIVADEIRFNAGIARASGGSIVTNTLDIASQSGLTLDGTDLTVNNALLGVGLLVMNDARLSLNGLVDFDSNGIVTLERVDVTGALLRNQGRLVFSGDWQSSFVNWSEGVASITGDTRFFLPVDNEADLIVLSGDVTFLQGFNNTGSFVVAPSASRGRAPDRSVITIYEGLVIPSDVEFALAPGTLLQVAGPFLVGHGREWNPTRPDAVPPLGLSGAEIALLGGGPGGFGQPVPIAAWSPSFGASPRGLGNVHPAAASVGTLRIVSGAEILFGQSGVPSDLRFPVIYLDRFIVEPGASVSAPPGEAPLIFYRELINDGLIDLPADRLVRIDDCTADLVPPFGVTDLADITAFVRAFGDELPGADYAEPFGVFDLSDLTAFIAAFTAPCD